MSMLNKQVGSISVSCIGLGTYGLQRKDMHNVFSEALDCGINYIDSAYRYGNEGIIASSFKYMGVNRHDVVIGTKLAYKQQISMSVEDAVDESLRNLQTDYIDLYFIHSPKSDTYCEDWCRLMLEKQKGKVLELGVSNFNIEQMIDIRNVSGCYPAINQIEINLGFYPRKIIEFCEEKGIAVQASCPLGRMRQELVNHETMRTMMNKYHRSYPQLALRWLYQNEILMIPKMSSNSHLMENISIFDFEIKREDMEKLNGEVLSNV